MSPVVLYNSCLDHFLYLAYFGSNLDLSIKITHPVYTANHYWDTAKTDSLCILNVFINNLFLTCLRQKMYTNKVKAYKIIFQMIFCLNDQWIVFEIQSLKDFIIYWFYETSTFPVVYVIYTNTVLKIWFK